MKIGVLAVQGDFEAHGNMLERLGVQPCFVRTAGDLAGLQGIILPGGESTTQWKFLQAEGLDRALCQSFAGGMVIFGTCAGAILLAKDVRNPTQASLGLLDVVLSRNGYGRQVDSEVRFGESKLKPAPLEMVFIRAPIIERVGPDIIVLARSEGQPVLIRQGRILIATFHPELTKEDTVHKYFVRLAGDHAENQHRGSVVSSTITAAQVEPR